MYYTGTIWRPLNEASSLLLQVTDIESDLLEAQLWGTDPMAMLSARLQGLPRPEAVRRVFLVGANPFVLSFRRLKTIGELIHKYFPTVESIGCFARVTDVALKSDEELAALHHLEYDKIIFLS